MEGEEKSGISHGPVPSSDSGESDIAHHLQCLAQCLRDGKETSGTSSGPVQHNGIGKGEAAHQLHCRDQCLREKEEQSGSSHGPSQHNGAAKARPLTRYDAATNACEKGRRRVATHTCLFGTMT